MLFDIVWSCSSAPKSIFDIVRKWKFFLCKIVQRMTNHMIHVFCIFMTEIQNFAFVVWFYKKSFSASPVLICSFYVLCGLNHFCLFKIFSRCSAMNIPSFSKRVFSVSRMILDRAARSLARCILPVGHRCRGVWR